MRYEKGHKEQTRKRVLDVAAARFRAQGIEGTGVAGLMADAGLTHGGFYAHFKSKDDLVRAAIAEAHTGSREMWAKEVKAAKERGEDGLEAIVHRYLRAAHRDGPEAGCSVAALAQEVARNDAETRDVMAHAADEMATIIASELSPSIPEETARETAYAIFGLLIGTLQLARVTTDKALSEAILRCGQNAALRLARHKA
ncbi:TetR/AcrR family transcriptional regulator [Microvirga lotononidis]|uniref:Transcriptional regulator n=1 Tax=Microvirga lotononidis TaxID=864069 RepID=I4YWN7_9HYPH|nr:TetR/AcrR family transcriptional regulator [Microvirga lotononidis]EIM28379.1 transcriptional regulator [Microvirga lotononidis]WQO27536.1 TetR/AcrR family transcriptional regulator [Microvirga lotononidis]